MLRMRASAMLLVAMGVSTVLYGAAIRTSVSCSFDGQATISDPHSCSVEQLSSVPSNRGTAGAQSAVTYAISGNALTVSFFQGGGIRSGAFSTPSFDAVGHFATYGSIDLNLESSGSGAGLAEVDIETLSEIDPAGEESGGIGFDLGAFSWSCTASSDPNWCGFFPRYPNVPFQLGSIVQFHMDEGFGGYVDSQEVNPLSAIDQPVTTFRVAFMDGEGNPVDLAEVPEPATAGLIILSGLLVIVRKSRQLKAQAFRERPCLSAGSAS